MIQMGVNVLVPLDSMSGGIWDTDFRGEILYCPITDYGVLPDDMLERLVENIIKRLDDNIIKRLDNGKRLGMFCISGHGRTGYVAACVLKRRGVKNPIAYLHTHYCRNAVESDGQREAIERFK